MLFAPANRPEMAAKMAGTGADVLVLDLEDAVPLSAGDVARAGLSDVVAVVCRGAGQRLLVRVHPPTAPAGPADLEAVVACPVDGVVVPKVEDPGAVRVVFEAVPSGWTVVVGLETAAGVHRAEAILEAGGDGCYFGAEDYVTDVGGLRTPEGREVLYARSRVAIAARLAGIPAIDQAVVDLGRGDGHYSTDAMEGRAIGYGGKLCIHPSQVPLANVVFSVTAEQRAWSRRVLSGAVAAAAKGHGAYTVDGEMIDEAMIRRARRWADDDDPGGPAT